MKICNFMLLLVVLLHYGMLGIINATFLAFIQKTKKKMYILLLGLAGSLGPWNRVMVWRDHFGKIIAHYNKP